VLGLALHRCTIRDRGRATRPGAANRIGSSSRGPVAVSLAIAATADAKILLGRSIDGVMLGMTHTQVANILGPGRPEPGYGLNYCHDSYQPGLHCVYDHMDGSRDCYVGTIKRGHVFTDFFFAGTKTVYAVIVATGYL
jgi:hypothetical protein